MKSKKVLVTGGAGYIGGHTVVELITAGYDPIVVDDLSKSDETLLVGIEKIVGKKPTFYKGNCCDKKFIQHVFSQEKTIGCVMHFAAYKSVGESVTDPLSYYTNNIGSLVTVLEVMKENNVRDFIFSSSCTVYGQPDQIPVDETAPFKRAESPYGATKQMGERILEDTYNTGLRVISLRYFNPIGAHPTALIGELPVGIPNNLLPYITQTATGKREKLTVFGNDYNTTDGSCIRDFIHVVDIADAHIKAMEHLFTLPENNTYRVFNLGTGIGVSVLELISKFECVNDLKINYSIGTRRPGDVEKVYADPTKIKNELGWTTRYTIEDALQHSWQWEKTLANK